MSKLTKANRKHAFHKGHIAWNIGLSKQVDPRIRAQSDKMRGRKQSEETLRKRAKAMKEAHKAGKFEHLKGVHLSLLTEFKKGHIGTHPTVHFEKGYTPWNKGIQASQEHRENISKGLKGHKAWNKGLKCKKRPDVSQRTKRLWQNKEWRENNLKAMFRGFHTRPFPNKPERRLGNLLNELFPNEFRYTGNGNMVIAGKVPDFTNVNGQKKLIELYGDYWHKGQNESDRIIHFAEFGYSTLIVWEHELRDLPNLKIKLFNFYENNSNSPPIHVAK